ncbi:flippase [Candidatus Saccharibacteria bacterium]|nr:flippase [Candidatus Saccharibacteria bacterium]
MTRKKIQPDEHFGEILVHTFWAMVLLGGTTALQFVFDLLLANRFGAHGAGTFYLAFSVMMTLSLIGRLGLDQAIVRFMPPLLSKNPAAAYGVKYTAVQLSLIITVPLVVGLYFLAPWLANDVFHAPDITTYLQVFAFGVPAFSLSYLFSASLRSMKQTRAALSVERAGMYLLGIIAIMTLGVIYGFKGLVYGFVIGIIVNALIGGLAMRHYMPSVTRIVPFDRKVLLLTSLPLLFVAFAFQMNGQASLLILGSNASSADVGIFNAALKISMLMNLLLAAINTIVATKISELYAASNQEELRKTIQKTSGLGTALSLPLFLIIVATAPLLLGLFGREFISGSTTLILLAVGQLINVAVGSTNYFLAMTGHQKALAVAIGSGLSINILTGLWLIPLYGIEGAAISTTITSIFSNMLMVFFVKKYLGVWSLPFVAVSKWLRLRG